ncbi:MAG: tRNA (N6-isopentenyl adenosine(37)-C2)-methylthiotransferase MiaB [Mycoplasmataceae bacterium]|nr:tRNA (N6-isopentenyl adenosine(37)-C2)-methylthiotransferase MiaB [Mycoplasmataceae bacterium]
MKVPNPGNTPSLVNARRRINDSKVIKCNFKLDAKLKKIGINKKYFVKTYGCQSNVVDGQNIAGILENMGYSPAPDILDADLIILNTCAVRENAELKVFGQIGLLKKLSKKPGFIFGICGCMAQEENVVNRIVTKIAHVNFVLGTHNLYELPYVIEEVVETKKQVIKVYSKEGDIIEGLPIIRVDKIKAFVNIMYGCDHFCTYCIVPYTRGKIRSRDKADIIQEINDLIKQGYQEVTLLGQNVNDYGIDKKDGYLFINLLEDVCKTKITRVRFATSNPWNFNKQIADLLLKYKNLMPYFHLPIQSGDEKMLARMNRKMKIDDYINLVKHIRKTIPNVAISTDLIVGFPNETAAQFNNTLKLFNTIKYDNAYTFIYSKRSGTPAATMPDKISTSTKQLRLAKLNELVRKYAKINNEKFLNQVIEVLVEGRSKTDADVLTGYSPEWKVVNFTGSAKVGTIARVKITSISRFSLNGVVV